MIDSFMGQYRWLSNFHLSPITFEGAEYPSVEHGYQAAKTTNPKLRLPFQEPIMKPAEARRAGQKLPMRSDWESIKIDVMFRCLKEKFKDPELKDKLINTGDEELIEGNWWGDKFWGVCNGVGENNLGKLLMKIREELK